MSRIKINFKPINPKKKMNPSQFVLEWAKVVEKEARIHENMLKRVTNAFRNPTHKPKYRRTVTTDKKFGQRIIVGEMRAAGKIVYWLNHGTKTRFATMSVGYRSGSRPRVLGFRQPRGRVLYVSRKKPRYGIYPRRWTDEIVRRRKGKFEANVRKVTSKAARKIWKRKL